MRPLRRIVLTKLLLSALAVSSCSFIRNIPAVSSPVREARYWRTQDAPNLVAGAVADEALRVWCPGPTQHVTAVLTAERTYRYRWFSGNQCPWLRVGVVASVALARRQLDRGYRESGAFMNVFGATSAELVHFIVTALVKHWGPVH